MSEKLVKVTSFGELRVGDLVVIKPCGVCGRTERGLLIRFIQCGEDIDSGEVEPGFVMHPCGPCNDGKYPDGVTPDSVARGIVFKVDVGLEAPAATTRTKRPLTTKGQ